MSALAFALLNLWQRPRRSQLSGQEYPNTLEISPKQEETPQKPPNWLTKALLIHDTSQQSKSVSHSGSDTVVQILLQSSHQDRNSSPFKSST
jgi:hypothetical protein